MLKNKEIDELKQILSKRKNIVILSHGNPDGDAIGSSLALMGILNKLSHNVCVILPDDIPAFYMWMYNREEIVIFDKDKEKGIDILNSSDIIFCLDFNKPDRIKDLSTYFVNSSKIKILIDHHLFPEYDFNFLISDIKASSTAELVYDFIVEMGYYDLIDKNIAEGLFVGIMTDTGSFSYSCNNSKTFQIAAELLKTGLDNRKIHNLVYDTFSEDRIRLMGYSISEKLVIIKKHYTAYISLNKNELQKYNYQVGDTEGLVNLALSIEGINVAALFVEKEDITKISFRSKGDFSVNDLARKHFNGGGHRNAAGGNTCDSISKAVDKFKNIISEYNKN